MCDVRWAMRCAQGRRGEEGGEEEKVGTEEETKTRCFGRKSPLFISLFVLLVCVWVLLAGGAYAGQSQAA